MLGLVNSSKICYVRYQSETEGYFINLRGPVPAEGDLGSVRLFRLNGLGYWPHGSWDTLVIVPFTNNVGNTYHVTVEVMGPEIVVYLDGTEYIRYYDTAAPVLSGRIGFAGFTGADGRNRARWDNVTVIVPTVKTESTTWGRVKALYRGN